MHNWFDPPRRSEVVDISSTDHTFSLVVSGVHNASASGGQITARLMGDSTDSLFYVPAGLTQPGFFTIIRRSGTTITATGCLRGVSPQATSGS